MFRSRPTLFTFPALTLALGLAGCAKAPTDAPTETKGAHTSATAPEPGIATPEPLIIPSPIPKLPDPGKPAMANHEPAPAPAGEIKPTTTPAVEPVKPADAPK